MPYLYAIIIPLLSFLLQAFPRIFNKHFGVDVWTRLIEIDLVRKNNHKIPGIMKNGFIIEGKFDYPPVFPFIFSFLSKKTLEVIQGFVSPFFDSLHCIVVFIIAYQITNNITIGLMAQLIYMTIPLIALENSYLTARSLGYLNFTLAFYPLILYSISPLPSYLLFAFISTTLIFLTHRFATQSLLFIVIFFSIIDKSFLYIFLFLLSGLTAIIITKGYYLRVLQGHWLNIYFWIVNYKNRFAHQITKSSLSEGRRDFVGRIYYILGKFSPITLIGLNSWLLVSFLFIYLNFTHPNLIYLQNSLYGKLSLWIIFFYIFAIIILSVKRLLPIGEGQRYLEMATVPVSITSSILFFSFLQTQKNISILLFISIFAINLLLILIVQIKLIINDKTRSKTEDMQKIFSYINKLSGNPRIMCIPHQITTMTIYNSKAHVLVNANNVGLFGNMIDFFPVLKRSIKEIAKEFNLDYLLLRESYATVKELRLQKKKVVFQSGDILLIKL
ncbi:MAG: hypothetical protein COU27_03005 [Candidatus Levybacteria bacterium CG10_big_fil_rev_8_21_14_0_10_36_7]|nr:MAG: hypothetical protein COU27_03005 [Candidatus Levybacteria bacterium CG10_big_fil_rev_8_21_14_0_10_36_7]